MTFSILQKSRLVSGLAFAVGQAVVVYPSHLPLTKPITPVAGIIRKVHADRLVVETATDMRRPRPCDVVHQGCCIGCRIGAIIEGGHLVCPSCGDLASPTIPPDLHTAWARPEEHQQAFICRYMLATDATCKAAYDVYCEHKAILFEAALKQAGIWDEWLTVEYFRRQPPRSDVLIRAASHIEAMRHYAVLGDQEGLVATFEEFKRVVVHKVVRDLRDSLDSVDDELETIQRPRPSYELRPLPEVDIDTEPDTDTDSSFDDWLDKQFGK